MSIWPSPAAATSTSSSSTRCCTPMQHSNADEIAGTQICPLLLLCCYLAGHHLQCPPKAPHRCHRNQAHAELAGLKCQLLSRLVPVRWAMLALALQGSHLSFNMQTSAQILLTWRSVTPTLNISTTMYVLSIAGAAMHLLPRYQQVAQLDYNRSSACLPSGFLVAGGSWCLLAGPPNDAPAGGQLCGSPLSSRQSP